MSENDIDYRHIQELQNSYQLLKKQKDPLGMLCIMWEIGDYLREKSIKRHHSFGWRTQDKGVFISRPMIFRSFVIRRIWNSKEELRKQLYGVKSVNSVIELFPFLDQNEKWKLPQEKLDELIHILNTQPAKEFNRYLLKVKKEHIGINTDRDKYLSELDEIKDNFYKLFYELKDVMENSSIEDCLKLRDTIGAANLKVFGRFCLDLAQDIEVDVNDYNFGESKHDLFSLVSKQMRDISKTKDWRKRLVRAIDKNDLARFTGFCNSLQSGDSIKGFRIRKGIKLSMT